MGVSGDVAMRTKQRESARERREITRVKREREKARERERKREQQRKKGRERERILLRVEVVRVPKRDGQSMRTLHKLLLRERTACWFIASMNYVCKSSVCFLIDVSYMGMCKDVDLYVCLEMYVWKCMCVHAGVRSLKLAYI